MEKIILALAFIFKMQLVSAQFPQVESQNVCNPSADFSQGTGLAKTPNDGYVIKVNDEVNNMKLNSSGALVWQQMYNNTGKNISNAHGGRDVFVGNGLTKTSETGNFLWDQGHASGS